MVDVVLTYFRSLTLVNLTAALHSVRGQDLSLVHSIIVVDNNTDDSLESIQNEIDEQDFPVPVRLSSYKHGDESKTHSWSTNVAVREATAPWVLFTRADYVLDASITKRFADVVHSKPNGWDGFVTAHGYHLQQDVMSYEDSGWRANGAAALHRYPGAEMNYAQIDSGVWSLRRATFARVGGLCEDLTAWGHAQTHFQHKLFQDGVEFVVIPEVLFYHPMHGGPRDIVLAHQQLQNLGVDVRDLWSRFDGVKPY